MEGFVTFVTLIKYLKANRIENTEKGMTVINKKRHPKYSNISPDNVRPIAGANIITSPTSPIIFPRLCGGYSSKKTLKIIGISNPVPTAWINLPTNNIGKLEATAHIV